MSEETLKMLAANVEAVADGLQELFDLMYAEEYTRDDWTTLVGHGIVDSQDWPYEEDETRDEDEEGPQVVDGYREVAEIQEAIREHLLDWPLEVVEHGTRSRGEDWEYTHAVIVFGTGGPHVEYDGDKGCIVGYWSGEQVMRSAPDGIEEFYGCGDI